MTLDLALRRRDGDVLSVLARADPAELARAAERVLPLLGSVEVIHSRSGLMMMPMRDTVEGAAFHLGEVLVAEAHIRLPASGAEGYGLVLGHDLERAMAMAVVDVALHAGIETQALEAFIARTQSQLAQADDETLRDVAATRVDMDSF